MRITRVKFVNAVRLSDREELHANYLPNSNTPGYDITRTSSGDFHLLPIAPGEKSGRPNAWRAPVGADPYAVVVPYANVAYWMEESVDTKPAVTTKK